MANEHMTRWLTPVSVKGMQIKTIRYDFIPTRIAKIKKTDNNKYQWECEEIRTLIMEYYSAIKRNEVLHSFL